MAEKMPSTEDAAAHAGPTVPQDAAAPQKLAALAQTHALQRFETK